MKIFLNLLIIGIIGGYLLSGCCQKKEPTILDELQSVESKALQGDSKAQEALAFKYIKGDGVPMDLQKASIWYEKSAAQGNPIAQNNLGNLYIRGEGVPKDLEKAAMWLEKSANQGNIQAQFNLGVMYANGLGVEKDLNKAKQWYEKAAAKNDNKAQYNLGVMHLYGEGLSRNVTAAATWFEKAANLGDPFAKNMLAVTYAERNINLDKGIELVEPLLQLNPQNADVLDTLGWLYYKKGDLKTASSYLEQAVDLKPDWQQAKSHLDIVKQSSKRK
jgi:TPR repeat protein